MPTSSCALCQVILDSQSEQGSASPATDTDSYPAGERTPGLPGRDLHISTARLLSPQSLQPGVMNQEAAQSTSAAQLILCGCCAAADIGDFGGLLKQRKTRRIIARPPVPHSGDTSSTALAPDEASETLPGTSSRLFLQYQLSPRLIMGSVGKPVFSWWLLGTAAGRQMRSVQSCLAQWPFAEACHLICLNVPLLRQSKCNQLHQSSYGLGLSKTLLHVLGSKDGRHGTVRHPLKTEALLLLVVRQVAAVLARAHARDVVIVDVSSSCDFADNMVICTGVPSLPPPVLLLSTTQVYAGTRSLAAASPLLHAGSDAVWHSSAVTWSPLRRPVSQPRAGALTGRPQ